MDLYVAEGLFARAAELAPHWEERAHALRGLPNVVDIRNYGLVCGIELAPRPDRPGSRGYDAFVRCFEQGALVRVTGDIIALSPPLIIERAEIDMLFSTVAEAVTAVG